MDVENILCETEVPQVNKWTSADEIVKQITDDHLQVKKDIRDFPSGPVVKTPCSTVEGRGAGSIPDGRSKIL